MNEPAVILLSVLREGVDAYKKQIASQARAIVGPEALTVEQHKVLEKTVEAELESFVWFVLGRFDNVGCSLPENVLGYRIIAKPYTRSETGELQRLPESDIREEEQDYADMWQDFLSARDVERAGP